jgi:hypothetical protein
MAVKGRLGHVGFGNDLVDAGGAKSLLVKEAMAVSMMRCRGFFSISDMA